MAARHEAGIAERYLQKAVRPTFADGKIDLSSLPEYEIGKWKTDRRKEAQTAPPESPAHNFALNRGSKFDSVKLCRSRFTQGVGCGCCQRAQLYVLAPGMEQPLTGLPLAQQENIGRFQSGRQRRRGPARPKVQPPHGNAHIIIYGIIYGQNGKWNQRTADAMRHSPADGASARAKVECKVRE